MSKCEEMSLVGDSLMGLQLNCVADKKSSWKMYAEGNIDRACDIFFVVVLIFIILSLIMRPCDVPSPGINHKHNSTYLHFSYSHSYHQSHNNHGSDPHVPACKNYRRSRKTQNTYYFPILTRMMV